MAFCGLRGKYSGGSGLDVRREVIRILDEAMGLNGRAKEFTDSTPLLGSVPELDSMAVVTIIGMLEDRFGLTVADDEIDGATFATFGSLVRFVAEKCSA
jgi:acyl carrier protein